MPGQAGQERLKARMNEFKHFFHSLVPGRGRSPSRNRAITPTLVSSTPVGPDPNPIHGPDTQPLNSPSLNIYPSIVEPVGDKTPDGKADLASTVFHGVKTTLQLAEKVADAFPPLKSTVSGLLGVIDIVEVCDFQFRLCCVCVMVLTVHRPSLKTNKIAKIWPRSWMLSSQSSIVMPLRPICPLSPNVSRVFRRRDFVDLILVT